MSRDSRRREELLAGLNDEFRQLSTVTILFHQAVADRLGMNVTDHKCADILLRTGSTTAGELAQRTGLTTGAITGVIDRLEKAGFGALHQGSCSGDRRRVVVEPLPQRIGREIGPLFESMAQMMAEVVCRLQHRRIGRYPRLHRPRARAGLRGDSETAGSRSGGKECQGAEGNGEVGRNRHRRINRLDPVRRFRASELFLRFHDGLDRLFHLLDLGAECGHIPRI